MLKYKKIITVFVVAILMVSLFAVTKTLAKDIIMADTVGDNVGIGTTLPSGSLKLDVEGQIGATEYCDENGANCFDYTDTNSAFNDGWDLYDNGVYEDRISEFEELDFNSSAGVIVSYDGVDDLTFSADMNYIQARVSSSCPTGSSIRVINSDGTVTCETDTDTNTNAATICSAGSFLNGDGSCDTISFTDTNAGTICGADQFLNGDGSCDSISVTDTNAGTICSSGQFLNGDNTCDSVPNTYSGWDLYDNGVYEDRITEYENVDFNSSTGVNVSYDGTDDLSFSFDCSDVAGKLLTCSGENLDFDYNNLASCPDGSSIREIFDVGSGAGVICQADNYNEGWNLYDNGTFKNQISESEVLDFNSSTGINVSYDGVDDLTFSFDCSDVAGSNLSCSGETLNATDTNTNAATECSAGYFLNGDGSCDSISVTDTNAGTICGTGQLLNGDGNCESIPTDTDTYNDGWDLHINNTAFATDRITEGENLDFVPSTGINISYANSEDLTFSFDCSDVAGTGLSCSGETLNADGGSSLWTENGSEIYYSAGDVGVGEQYPNSRLHVDGASGSSALRVQVTGSSKLTVASNGGTTIGAYNNSPPSNGLYVSGSVGIGTSSPSQKLEVDGSILAEGSSYGVKGMDTGGSYGELGSGNYGVYGNGVTGVYGYGTANGVYGGGDTYGVYGNGPYGVYGQGSSYGVKGSGSSYGVKGEDADTGFYGELGSGNYGVYGDGAYGVWGEGTNYGVYGGGTYGVYGDGTYGVYGVGDTYSFYASGTGTNYGPFTGGHEVKLSKDCPEDIKPGMLVSVTGETQFRKGENESASLSSTLPTVSLSSSENDKKIFGVFTKIVPLPEDHWYYDEADKEDRFATANALGEGRVLVTNYNGEIEAGDYITTSNIAGYGMKQNDDLLHSYTLGKATEDVNWIEVEDTIGYNGKEYKFYLISVVYTSG